MIVHDIVFSLSFLECICHDKLWFENGIYTNLICWISVIKGPWSNESCAFRKESQTKCCFDSLAEKCKRTSGILEQVSSFTFSTTKFKLIRTLTGKYLFIIINKVAFNWSKDIVNLLLLTVKKLGISAVFKILY